MNKNLMNKIEVAILTVGAIQTNCYIVNKEGSDACIVIDPGDEAEKIADYMKRHGLKNEAILLTHGHFDHIMGVSKLLSLVGGKLYAYEAEKELLSQPDMNCSPMMRQNLALEPEYWVKDNQNITIAGIDMKVLHTPGHTIGSCCYYLEEEKVVFSGDTIFLESVGRSDFPTGNGRQLIESIHERIFTLPDEVILYPGHGPETKVGYEKLNNPFA